MLNNVLGQPVAAPFHIWANADCANKTEDFAEAKRIRQRLIDDGADDVYIADADGVEVVDAEVEGSEHAQAAMMARSAAEAGPLAGWSMPSNNGKTHE